MQQYFAACPKGLEYLLVDELKSLGAEEVRESLAGVRFSATLSTAYKVCLWSRLASRILQTLGTVEVNSTDELYDAAFAIDWPALFGTEQRIAVDFTGTNKFITNTQFGALKVKDAIVDKFRDCGLERPNVDKQQSDVRIECRLHGRKASFAVNFSGRSLQQRGYRAAQGAAPMRENLAAALLMRSGWQPGKPLLDPFCGSGTLVIEAALMAANIAPSLTRGEFAFSKLANYNAKAFNLLMREAQQLASESKAAAADAEPLLFGVDQSSRMVNIARDNARRAGVAHLVSFSTGDAAEVQPPVAEPGHLVTNPPYGERLGELLPLVFLHHRFARQVKANFADWTLSVFTASPELLLALRLSPDNKYALYNGQLEATLANYKIAPGELRSVSKSAEPFANRLKKNAKLLGKWARNEGVNCYRLYDADLPDFNLAIDRYDEQWVLQEYAAPKQIAREKTQRRLIEAFVVLDTLFDIAGDKITYKVREQKKGDRQYEKLNKTLEKFPVQEYNAQFLINTSDYLDNGLFLDHRLTRKKIQQLADGTDFLNLFCYTASASVHAALGGAATTTSVDMSNTYLNWARENFKLNGLTGPEHNFVQMDCLTWLAYCQSQYDLIFIDPPTFSNSKRMAQTLDVNRDHGELMRCLQRILRPGGLIIFSNNSRQFKMDEALLDEIGLVAKNITKQTLSRDFQGNQKIHNCWEIRHK